MDADVGSVRPLVNLLSRLEIGIEQIHGATERVIVLRVYCHLRVGEMIHWDVVGDEVGCVVEDIVGHP